MNKLNNTNAFYYINISIDSKKTWDSAIFYTFLFVLKFYYTPSCLLFYVVRAISADLFCCCWCCCFFVSFRFVFKYLFYFHVRTYSEFIWIVCSFSICVPRCLLVSFNRFQFQWCSWIYLHWLAYTDNWLPALKIDAKTVERTLEE